mgnify:CR=1 FL=1
MGKRAGLLKLVILAAILLTIIQKVTGSSDITENLLENFQALVIILLPAILIIGGLYILVRCLFR